MVLLFATLLACAKGYPAAAAPIESPCLGEFVLAEDGVTCELDANGGFPDEPTAYLHSSCPHGFVCPDGSCVGSGTEFAVCSTGKTFRLEEFDLSGVWNCGGLVCDVQQSGNKLVVIPTQKGDSWLNGSGVVDEITGKVKFTAFLKLGDSP